MALRQLSGDNYDWLVDVRTKHDPENLFRANGAIEPRPAAD